MKKISIAMLVLFATLIINCGNDTIKKEEAEKEKEEAVAAAKAAKDLEKEEAVAAAIKEMKEKAQNDGIYSKFEETLLDFRTKFTAKKTAFATKFAELETKIKTIPTADLNNVDYTKKDNFYTLYLGLGNVEGTITKLEEIIKTSTLNVTTDHKDAVAKLINLLYSIGDLTNKVVNVHLANATLSKYKDRIIKEGAGKLVEFIKLRREIIEDIKELIESAATKTADVTKMLAELNKITVNTGDIYKKINGNENSLVKLETKIADLMK